MVNKTAFVVGALAGGSVAVAAMAGAGMKLPLTTPHGGALIPASTAPIFSPPPGAPQSFADIFEHVSPAVVSIHVTSKVDVAQLRRQIPGFENFPFEIVPRGEGNGDEDRPPPKQQSSGCPALGMCPAAMALPREAMALPREAMALPREAIVPRPVRRHQRLPQGRVR